MVVVFGGVFIGLDRFTARCPGFSHLRRWHRRRQYRPGRVVSRFLAPDVRRDIQVMDASGIDAGLLTVRIRTSNALYAIYVFSGKESCCGKSHRAPIRRLTLPHPPYLIILISHFHRQKGEVMAAGIERTDPLGLFPDQPTQASPARGAGRNEIGSASEFKLGRGRTSR
jgi:hypothetical protein